MKVFSSNWYRTCVQHEQCDCGRRHFRSHSEHKLFFSAWNSMLDCMLIASRLHAACWYPSSLSRCHLRVNSTGAWCLMMSDVCQLSGFEKGVRYVDPRRLVTERSLMTPLRNLNTRIYNLFHRPAVSRVRHEKWILVDNSKRTWFFQKNWNSSTSTSWRQENRKPCCCRILSSGGSWW